MLDSPPGPVGPGDGPDDAIRVLHAVRASIQGVASDRGTIRASLLGAGITEPIAAWLCTSLQQTDAGWRWKYDMDGVESMLRDYLTADFWPFLDRAARVSGPRVRFLRAGRSDRWRTPDLDRLEELARGGRVTLDTLPDAGHWLHVDDPAGTLAAISQDLV